MCPIIGTQQGIGGEIKHSAAKMMYDRVYPLRAQLFFETGLVHGHLSQINVEFSGIASLSELIVNV